MVVAETLAGVLKLWIVVWECLAVVEKLLVVKKHLAGVLKLLVVLGNAWLSWRNFWLLWTLLVVVDTLDGASLVYDSLLAGLNCYVISSWL